MGKIFLNQTTTLLSVSTGLPLQGTETILIKYIKPKKSESSFVATFSDTTGVIEYEVIDGDLDEYGTWIFWSHITFVDGTVIMGDKEKVYVWEEGEC